MALTSASSVTLSTAEEREAMVQALSEDDSTTGSGSVAPTPDYHLPWTGQVVEMAIQKILDLDIEGLSAIMQELGGIITLESTAEKPADLDTVLDPGLYRANYATATGMPAELDGVVPIELRVYSKGDNLFQVMDAMGNRWYRYSTDGGETWSVWNVKATNSGSIEPGEGDDPNVPVKDPIEQIQDQLNIINTAINNMVSFGSEELATAMLTSKYDYDSGEIITEASGSTG